MIMKNITKIMRIVMLEVVAISEVRWVFLNGITNLEAASRINQAIILRGVS